MPTRALTRAAAVRLVTLPAAVALGLAPAACADRPEPEAVVRVAIGQPRQLLPGAVDGVSGEQLLSALFTPLVAVGPDGRPHPVAAQSVEPDPDWQLWTVTLRDGHTFHNGEPVTAERYLAGWNHAVRHQPNHYYYSRIAGYDAVRPTSGAEPTADRLAGLQKVDDRTFTVRLTAPFREFPAMLATPAFYPLPAAAFDPAGGLREEFARAPVGNGPFRLVGPWQPGEPIEVVRYGGYAGEPPQLDRVEFVTYRDPTRKYTDLRAGAVDVVTGIPAGQRETAAAELGDRYQQQPAGGFQYLAFPSHHEQLADPEVRRAISMAIDREAITGGIFHGAQLPARSFVPPVIPGARPDACGQACRLDPGAARARYARAGGPSQLTITYNADGAHQEWLAATCRQLRTHLGVQCRADPAPQLVDVVALVEERAEVGMLRSGWVMDYLSMESYLGPLFTSTGSANLHGYRNPQVDALVAAAAAADTRQAAVAAYQRAEDLVAQDLPVIPIRFDTYRIGHAPQVQRVSVTPLGQLDLTRLAVRH